MKGASPGDAPCWRCGGTCGRRWRLCLPAPSSRRDRSRRQPGRAGRRRPSPGRRRSCSCTATAIRARCGSTTSGASRPTATSRNQLFAIDFSYPSARRDDSKPQPFRSSTEDQMKELAAFVAQVQKATRRRKVALIASSRGGNAVRNYLKNGGGAEFGEPRRAVRHAQQGHRDLRHAAGRQRVQRRRAVPQGAQRRRRRPDRRRRDDGDPLRQGTTSTPSPTAASSARPASRPASATTRRSCAAPGTSSSTASITARWRSTSSPSPRMYEFITGKPPATLFIAQEPMPMLNGRVTGIADGALHQPRRSPAPRSRSTRSTPRPASARATAAGASQDDRRRRPVGPLHRALRRLLRVRAAHVGASRSTHTYRSPFLRSSDVVHLRPAPFAKGDEACGRRRGA